MKLVRDKVPQKILADGRTPITHTATQKEYKQHLFKKLEEEVLEVKKDLNEEELADVIEVIYALGKLIHKTPKQIETKRKQKLLKNGGFTKKIILENA